MNCRETLIDLFSVQRCNILFLQSVVFEWSCSRVMVNKCSRGIVTWSSLLLTITEHLFSLISTEKIVSEKKRMVKVRRIRSLAFSRLEKNEKTKATALPYMFKRIDFRYKFYPDPPTVSKKRKGLKLFRESCPKLLATALDQEQKRPHVSFNPFF